MVAQKGDNMKKEFIVNRQGKDFCLFAGLLDQAHSEGLKRITTSLLQAPTSQNGNMAICIAEVETAKGVFTGIGDASPDNVGRMIAMHCIRMAETRAKARALRDAINVGVTAFEELGDIDEDAGDGRGTIQRQQAPVRQQQANSRPIPLNPHNANTATGEIPDDDKPAPKAWLEKLHALNAELGNLTAEPLDLPSWPTRAQAKAAKAEIEGLIALERQKRAPVEDDSSLESIGV
jgi:hypothetical protein